MVYGGQTSLEHEGLSRGRRIRLREDDLDLVLRAIPEFEFGSPSYGRGRTHLEAGENQTTTYMEGVSPIFSELRRMFPAPGGRFINQRDLDQRRRVLFLGDEIAARLFGDTRPVGQTVLLDGLSFRVIGVMESKFQDSSNNGPDENRAVIPASTFRSIYGNEFVNHLLVRPRNVADAPVAKRELYRVLGGRHRFDPTDERALGIWDFIEDEKIVGQIGFGIQVFLGLVGAFTLLVAGEPSPGVHHEPETLPPDRVDLRRPAHGDRACGRNTARAQGGASRSGGVAEVRMKGVGLGVEVSKKSVLLPPKMTTLPYKM